MKAILFDFDGTICDSLPMCLESFKKTLEPIVGREIQDNEITDTFGTAEEGIIKDFCPQQYEEGVESFYENYKNLHNMCPAPFDGIIEILDYIKQKDVFLGLITGKGKTGCDISLDYYGIRHYFEVIKTGSPQGDVKLVHMNDFLSQYNFDANEVIYIGDTVGDIESCRKAGISIVSAAYSSFVDAKDLIEAKPDKICYSVDELKNYIEKIV